MNFNTVALMSPTKRPTIATLVGGPGIGKTSLAALFPDPIIMKTEDGTKSLDQIVNFNPSFKRENVAVFGDNGKDILFTNFQDMKDGIQYLRTAAHKRKTLIIDSVTQADTIFQAEVLKIDPKAKSINQAGGGYGAGWNMVANMHREIRELCGLLAEEREMNIVFIAHEALETVDSPDSESYMRGTLRMNAKCTQPYIDNVDLVAFLKLESFVVGDEKKRATSSGRRMISCHSTPANVGKNRFGIVSELDFDLTTNPLADYL